MGKLQAALAWAARGFRVFPLQVNSKDPLKDMSWTEVATTDPDQIRIFWTCPVTGFARDYNIAFLTTGWIVLDVDVKKGKKGLETFFRLGLDFDTLTMRTPSGGFHCVYKGEAGQSPIGEGIDVRSHNGYVVAPGSTLDGLEYVVEIDQPVLPFPEPLTGLLKPPKRRAPAPNEAVDMDRLESLEIALYYLQRQAPHAEEGNRGWTCYNVACRLRDLAISEFTAGELLVEHWNEFNEPPMGLDDLILTVGNAYRYATGGAGLAAPAASFGDVKPVELSKKMNGHDSVNGALGVIVPFPYRVRGLLPENEIRPRPWILGDILQEGVITSLVAAGGSGKSTFALTMAAHIAVGRDFLGHKCWRPGKSILYNAEEDLEEMSRRMWAICRVYELDLKTIERCVSLEDIDSLGLRITENTPPRENERATARLLEILDPEEFRLASYDPLAELHTARENDNIEMAYVMSVIRRIARCSHTAGMPVIHTGKPSAASSSTWAGNQDAARGASSQGAAARIVLTLFPASEKDIDEIGATTFNRHLYVRLDRAKGNFSAKEKTPRWLYWSERQLASGDRVGVLLPYNAVQAQDHLVTNVMQLIEAVMVASGQATLPLVEIIDALRRDDPLLAKEDSVVVRKRIERILENQREQSSQFKLSLTRLHGVWCVAIV